MRHKTSPKHVEAVLARCPNSKGAGKLRAVLGGEVRVRLSKLEKGFLERLRAAGLPLPVTNRPAGGRRVDCRWPEHRLTVELDNADVLEEPRLMLAELRALLHSSTLASSSPT